MNFTAIREQILNDPDSHPWTSEPEVGQFLFSLCKMMNVERALEVGVWKGYTTLWLAEAVGWENTYAIDIENNLPTYYPVEGRQRLRVGNSIAVIESMLFKFQLVFLDTDHQYESTKRELEALQSVMSLGGLICCHDVLTSPGVNQAVFESSYKKILLPTPNGKGLAVLQSTK